MTRVLAFSFFKMASRSVLMNLSARAATVCSPCCGATSARIVGAGPLAGAVVLEYTTGILAAGLAEADAAVEAGAAAGLEAAADVDGAGLVAGALLAGAALPPHPASARAKAMGPRGLTNRITACMP